MSETTTRNYSVHPSSKLGGDWEQGFVVVRNKQAFLRFVGNDGQYYRLMTASTGGDLSGTQPCMNQERLRQAAELLAQDYGHQAASDYDRQGRLYVMPFEVRQEADESDESFGDEILGYFDQFFQIYDELEGTRSR